MEPYELLANAVVIQAADDYRYAAKKWHRACKAMKKARSKEERFNAAVKKRNAAREMKKLERFFLGRWCALLTPADGEYILEKLKKEMRL